MIEEARKAQLTDLTGGLRCRCPGNEELIRVQCRGFNGVRYCYFACSAPGSSVETRHPVGVHPLCRCSLGTEKDPDIHRTIEFDGDVWGFSACAALPQNVTQVEVPPPASPKGASLWPVAIGLGALFWYVTARGK
jgi:hypothetical protein